MHSFDTLPCRRIVRSGPSRIWGVPSPSLRKKPSSRPSRHPTGAGQEAGASPPRRRADRAHRASERGPRRQRWPNPAIQRGCVFPSCYSPRSESTPSRPMKATPNIPSRTPAVSRTLALELGGFCREPMKRTAAAVPDSRSPLRRLSVAISLGIAAQHRSAMLARSDPGMPSVTSLKRVAVKRRANRGFDPGEPPLASFNP